MIYHNEIKTGFVLTLSALLVAACALTRVGQTTEADQTGMAAEHRLQASLYAPTELPLGEAVDLQFTLTNRSTSAVYVLQWFTPLEGIAGEIFRVERDGQVLLYEGILASRASPTQDAYVHLEPGESVSAQVDLATSYDFSQAGQYTIAFLSPRISHVASSVAEFAESLDDLGPVQISSDPITITIVSPGDASTGPTPEMAAAFIRAYLHGQKPDLEEGFLLPLQELPIEQAWELLNIRLFRVTEGLFANETFLIREEQVIQLGSAIGGQGLTSVLVSDLDQDGVAELLYTYSFGSGIHQSRIGMYAPAYAADRTYEAASYYLGDLGLYLDDKIGVGARVVEADPENLRLRYLSTLGTLKLDVQDRQPNLVLKVADDLPEEIRENLVVAP
jgi:hypothetical protein